MRKQQDFNNYDTDNIKTEAIVPDKEYEDDDTQMTFRIDSCPARIESGVSSVIGSRSVQQDAARVDSDYMYLDKNVFLAVMCDGMGGMKGGEKASKLCVTKMFEAFYCVDVNGKVPAFFKFMVTNIDKMIYNLTDDNGNSIKSGSTLASVIIEGKNLYWVSVGDSRIYLKRKDEMVCVTTDHNYAMVLEQKVKKGLISAEEAKANPEREALVSYMGMGGLEYIDINPNPLELLNGDCILLCSDGLYRALSAEEIKSVIDSFDDTQTVAEALTAAALAKGKRNQDNTTAVLLRYVENKA